MAINDRIKRKFMNECENKLEAITRVSNELDAIEFIRVQECSKE